jgi:methylated-DNA-[protein]-cysteine S-methyltransferase
MTHYTRIDGPIGPLLLVSNGVALTGLYMDEPAHGPVVTRDWTRDDSADPLRRTREQLAAYFAGERTSFDVPLALEGTSFQRAVWAQLLRIPYGEVVSYGQIAARLEKPGASRAVGLANGRNPVSIIVPCHRVIGSTGKLTGYGGGLDRKQALLDLEARVLGRVGSISHGQAALQRMPCQPA